MGLVERLKRTVLSILGIHPQQDLQTESTDTRDRPPQAETLADLSDVDAKGSERERLEEGEEPAPNSHTEAEPGPIGEEEADTESTSQADGAAAESPTEEGLGSEEPGSESKEESTEAVELEPDESAENEDLEEVDDPVGEVESETTDTDDSLIESSPDDTDEVTGTEETDSTSKEETRFEFGKTEDEPETAAHESEAKESEDKLEIADEEPASVEPGTDKQGIVGQEEEHAEEASIPDATKLDEVAEETDQDASEEESQPPTEGDEAEEADTQESDDPGAGLSEELDGTPDDDTSSEIPDIEIPGIDSKSTKSRTPTTERRIPWADDLDGNEVHVDDAEIGQPYICKECEWPLKLRTSDKIRNYFAHQRGAPDDCPLKSPGTTTEKDDRDTKEQRQLPVFFGHSTRSVVRLYGEIPALEFDDFDDPTTIQTDLENIRIDTQGTEDRPRPDWFGPANSRVDVGLDPNAVEYRIAVDADDRFERIEGSWTADGLSPGDVFIGERARAERVKTETPVVKEGQWVFVVLDKPLEDVPEPVDVYHAGTRDILGIEVDDETIDHLQEYADVVESREATFTVDVLLPPDVDPRTDTVSGEPGTEVLVGIQPTDESDPIFQVVVPGDMDQNATLESTGEGRPRFYASKIPQAGSELRDIHGPGDTNSIELISHHGQEEDLYPWKDDPLICVYVGDGESQFLNPIQGPTSQTFGPDIDADAISSSITFEGPEGYRFDLKAEFPDDVDFASVVRRSEVTAEDAQTAISTWILERCDRVEIDFDAVGKTELVFDRQLNCRVVLEAGVRIYDVRDEQEAINIAVPKIGRMLNQDLSYVDIDAPDVPCPHCGGEHSPAFIAADTALVRLQLTMDVFGVENTTHAERIAKAEIGKRVKGIPLKTVEVERQ